MEDGFGDLGVMINQNTPNFIQKREAAIGRFTFHNRITTKKRVIFELI